MSFMILPKGIVVNTAEVYAEVASCPIVPIEKLHNYWHVYTTTQRTLIDPTAQRLENFWWHVWGSNRRNLSGSTIARLYRQISTEPTFVPLRGPPNRWEGPPTSRRHQHSQHEADRRQARNDRRQGLQQDSQSQGSLKPLSSSSSKPPPLHPILKKPRGPSSSGPRPTARFVSPPGSGDEGGKNGAYASSAGTLTDLPEGRPSVTTASTAKADKKKGPPGVAKKFVASSSSKRRPLLPRRPSSQSSTSTSSEVGSREAAPSGSRYMNTPRPKLSSEEQSTRTITPKSQDVVGSASSQKNPAGLSVKAAGKRPATEMPPQHSSLHLASTPSQPGGTTVSNEAPRAAPAEQPRTGSLQDEVNRRGVNTAWALSTSLQRVERTVDAPKMARSSSNIEYQRPRDASFGRAPPRGLLSSSVASTSAVAVQGTFDFDQPERIPKPAPPGDDRPDFVSRPSAASLLESHFTPTQPSPTPSVPLGRSKSQLTLLLERNGDGRKPAPEREKPRISEGRKPSEKRGGN